MTVIAMSRREIDRMHVLRDMAAGRITASETAQLMRLTRRHVFWLAKAYRERGPAALISGLSHLAFCGLGEDGDQVGVIPSGALELTLDRCFRGLQRGHGLPPVEWLSRGLRGLSGSALIFEG